MISKKLILSACEPNEDISRIIDQKDGSEIEFITFGNVEFNGKAYVFGSELSKYLQQLERDCDAIEIMIFEILEDNSTKHCLFSSDVHFAEREMKEILRKIKYTLSSIAVSMKYDT